AVAPDVGGSAGNVERLRGLAKLLRVDHVLRRGALRVEHDAELRLIGHLLADRVVVEVELDLRSRLQQTAGAFWKQIAVLADGKLVEELAGVAIAVVAVAVAHLRIDRIRQQMMYDR